MKLNEVYNIDEAMQHTHEHMHDDDYEDCSACSGTGEGRWEGTTCNVCHGTGVEPSDQDDDGYDDVEDEPAELTPFEPEAEYEKYVRTKGLGEAEATTAQRVAAAPYGYNGQTGKPNPAPVAQPAAPVVDQAAIDRQAAKFGLPPGSTKEQLVAAIQSKNFAQPAAQPAPAAVAQPAAQPAPVKGAVGQAAMAADAAGQNPEAAALAAMQKKNPKLAALMAQAGMNPDGTDMQQGVAEARKASTKAARAEFGRRTSSRPTLSDKEQAKKKAESDAAWARLMAYADEQKNKEQGVAEGFDLNNKSTSNTNSSPEFRGVNIPGNMKHPDWNEPAWSFQEVADKLGISASELNGYVAMLPGFPNKSEGLKSKYGSKAYFPRSAIKRWVNATNIRDIIKSKKGVAEDSDGGITESPDYAAMFEAKLTEMGAGSIATSIAAPSAKAGTLFGGDYSQKNSPFKKNKPKKTGMIKR